MVTNPLNQAPLTEECRKEQETLDEKSTIEIYERLGSIEAKIDDIRGIRDLAHSAEKQASTASSLAVSNLEHIRRLENNFKWLFGVVVSVMTPILVIVINFMIG